VWKADLPVAYPASSGSSERFAQKVGWCWPGVASSVAVSSGRRPVPESRFEAPGLRTAVLQTASSVWRFHSWFRVPAHGRMARLAWCHPE
jgi:hypothetical protein